jgi:7-dehydrocholesterol reductase
MWAGKDNTAVSSGFFPAWARTAVGPLLLMATTPVTSVILSRAVTSPNNDGAFLANAWAILREMQHDGVAHVVLKDAFNPTAWKIIAAWMVTQLVLMRLLPGEVYLGPKSPRGNHPVYVDNCFLCYVSSFVLFGLGVQLGLFNGGIAFDYFPQIIASLNVFALLFCGLLYLKGIHRPSSSDSGASGNVVFDYYWGTELYPRILGWDVKVFTNCRHGMTGWALLCVSFACAQAERNGGHATNSIVVSALLQVIYLAKFHIWERGYMFTIDIMHDRAGYYICWGCLVWVPSLYTAHTAFLVLHPYVFPAWAAAAQLLFGCAAIYLNYDVDRQRQEFRARAGKIKINGKDAEYLVASYVTTDGNKHSSMLLYSGWWGRARKINYFFEMCAAFSWGIVFAHPTHFIPYFYTLFLGILLWDRAWRDDQRMKDKYGPKWTEYCGKVRYMLVPYVY